MAREEAVVDSVMANGLVDNGQSELALSYVLQVVKARKEEQVTAFAGLILGCYLVARSLSSRFVVCGALALA